MVPVNIMADFQARKEISSVLMAVLLSCDVDISPIKDEYYINFLAGTLSGEIDKIVSECGNYEDEHINQYHYRNGVNNLLTRRNSEVEISGLIFY